MLGKLCLVNITLAERNGLRSGQIGRPDRGGPPFFHPFCIVATRRHNPDLLFIPYQSPLPLIDISHVRLCNIDSPHTVAQHAGLEANEGCSLYDGESTTMT